jgi:trimeric autotransporter adhesin
MAIKFLHDLDVQGNIDFNDNQALNMVLQQLVTNPASVVEGMIFQNTTSDKVYVGLNGSWVELSSAIGDITEVIGGTNINVSGGTSGAATVNLDSSVTDAIALNTAKTGITAGQTSAITANTAKTGISSSQASAITANTSKTGITSSQASAIAANTAKTGISSAQASAISANSAKVSDINHNVTTDLDVTATDSSLVITSSDGDDASIPAATTSAWGAMTDGQVSALIANSAKTGITSAQASAITANTAKTGISSAQASAITANTAKTGISSSQASAITANTAKVGITTSQAEKITANSAKVSDVNHNVSTNLGITGTTAARVITSSDGTDATIPVATTSVSGVMSASQVSTLNGKANTASPTFTGTPAAPTASAATNSTQIATTAYVTTAVSNLVGGAPGALNTLNELAEAIGDDDDYAATITTALGTKAPTASPTFTGTVSGITKAMVGLGNVANIAVSGTNTGDEPDAATGTKGIVQLASTAEALAGENTTKAVTPAGLAARSYRAAIGGSASIAVSHGLNSRDVVVQMYDSTTFDTVYAQVVRTSASVVTVGFNSAPSSGAVTILITKID